MWKLTTLSLLLSAGCSDGVAGAVDAQILPDAAIDAPACVDAERPVLTVGCPLHCPAIAVHGDPPATTPGMFKGYADPSIVTDPTVSGRVWLAYSWPYVHAGTDPSGNTVLMAAVENHLARSDDGGATFVSAGDLWPAVARPDPEGSGEDGLFSSETASTVAMETGGTVIWYGAHLRYFLRPLAGYNPKYGTSWHVRIGAAPSPPELSTAPETVLGVSTTAAVYQARASLDQLAGLPIQHCAMLNNPSLFAEDGTLYLIVECLAFVGTTLDHEHSTTQVFATTPAGAPATWTWRHAGVLADHTLAAELDEDTVQQPDVSRAADGTVLLLITPAADEDPVQVGTAGQGCVAVELASVDPPVIRRDCDGRAVVRAVVTGAGIGACTHDPGSATGIVGTWHAATDDDFTIHRSALRP